MSRESGPPPPSNPVTVVCVVPATRRSSAEPPVFSSPSLAAQPSPARLASQPAAPPQQQQQPQPQLPLMQLPAGGAQGPAPAPAGLPLAQAPPSHVVHGLMTNQQPPPHPGYGENLSVKQEGPAAPYSAAAAATLSTAPQVSTVDKNMGGSVEGKPGAVVRVACEGGG